MARGALFTGIWSRCPEHNNLLEPGEIICSKCKLVQRNLSLTPPFPVYAKTDYWNKFKEGNVYEVYWIIKDALNQYGIKVSGYVFQNEDKSLWEHVADPLIFIPIQYLTEDNKDKWLSEES